MANQFLKLRRSSVPGKIPDTGSLDYGEIALNTYDGLAFMKKSGSNGEEVVTIGSKSGSFYGSFTGSLQGTASWAINTATASSADNFLVRGTLTAQTIVAQYVTTSIELVTGSLTVSGSLNVLDGITGSLFGTASFAENTTSASYAATASIQYVTNSVDVFGLSQIEVADYSSDVAITFTNGRLKFIFGAPQSQSISSFSFNSTFATDRFNQVFDAYTASAVWNNGGYTLISASIFEGSTLLAQAGGTSTSLNYNANTTGSHTYILYVTSSNPSNNSILVVSSSLTGTISKTSPGSPTITPTATVQLGAASNQIEQGATGSISFTSASGAANSWVLNYVTSSTTSPYYVTGSATGSTSIILSVTASYSSSGVNGSDNNPALTTFTYGSSTFTKIRSLRSGASTSSSFTQAELENLALWDTTLGGSIGTISKGTTTASGNSVTITWTGDKYHYIIYNGSLSFLTNITAAGFGVLSAFTSSSIGNYKVYRTTTLQSGYSGQTITYALT